MKKIKLEDVLKRLKKYLNTTKRDNITLDEILDLKIVLNSNNDSKKIIEIIINEF